MLSFYEGLVRIPVFHGFVVFLGLSSRRIGNGLTYLQTGNALASRSQEFSDLPTLTSFCLPFTRRILRLLGRGSWRTREFSHSVLYGFE
jgi:hypothetical protein